MKLSDQILRKPFYVAFGQALQSGGITSVDLVAVRDATTVTLTASDGSAAPIAGADAGTAGVMTAVDKAKLDSLPTATARDFATKLDVATSTIGAGITHLRTAGHSAAGDDGDALYKRVASAPSHALKVQSADLAWWEIVPLNGVIPFQACGGIEGDSAANGAANVTAFNDFIGYAQAFFVDGITADGPTLQFPKGDYHFDDHLNVKAAVRIQGAGGFGEGVRTGTVFHFPTGSNGIIIQAHNTIDEITESNTFTGLGTIIEGLHLIGGGFGDTTGHGIWMRAAAEVRNCFVTQFGLDGFHIVANAGSGGATEGNTNQWRLYGCLAKRNGRHGYYIDDADANAGKADTCDASLNARWGFFDGSLLGNTFVACHTQQNGVATVAGNASDSSSRVSFGGNHYSANVGATEAQLVATTPGTDEAVWILRGSGGVSGTIALWVAAKPTGTYFHGGGYHTDGVGASSIFIGCYRENDQGENQVRAPAAIFQGEMGANKSSGFSQRGSPTGAEITGAITYSNSGTFFETATRDINFVVNPGYEKVLRLDMGSGNLVNLLAWDEADDAFMIGEYANSSSARPILITSGTSVTSFSGRASGLAGGEVIFGKGIFVGDHRFNARHMTNGTAAPTTGEHAQGEIVWNRSMAVGAPLGWVCVSTGTPGTWVEIRGVANQTSGASQTAITNSTGGIRDGTLAAVGDTSTADQSATINGNLTELHTLLDEVRTTLVNFGLMKGGV